MKKENVMSILLKAGIIGLGTLGGFAVSKLFSVVCDDCSSEEPKACTTDSAIEVPFTDVSGDVSTDK